MGIMKLKTQLALVSVLVDEQDEALHFYTEKLGLEKRKDVTFGPGLRLLTVASRGQKKPEIALARPDAALHDPQRIQELMEQSGQGKPWIFVTDNCCKTYETLLGRGVRFVREPTREFYGIEAIFEDPSGNTFSLLEASPEALLLLEDRRVGTAA
jgi:catechol 2,3-dioxygenase-like lactoylglutathione lyase family enzyme